jgi:cellulose synthase/poly-beta-1,6-N-acetylglucosamine synthase-like glycosyltransferase
MFRRKTLTLVTIFGPFLWMISLFLILYTYLGYPFLLFLFSLSRPSNHSAMPEDYSTTPGGYSSLPGSDALSAPVEGEASSVPVEGKASSAPVQSMPGVNRDEIWPAVSIIISAYNEEGVIEEKMKNSLQLDYPPGKLEIVVASDGSTDRTNQLAALYQDKGVRLLWQKERQGKSALLNHAVPQTNGEIIVFTDANAFLNRSALQNLVQHFQDNRVGFVTGRTSYTCCTGGSVEETAGMYNRYERYLKKKESGLGSCVGADGAIFAVRKNLYLPLRPGDLNDLTIPLQVIQQGYRGIMETSAIAREESSPKMESEIHRQIRITNRTLRALSRNRELLNPFHNPLFAWQLLSHKLLRLMVPFLMMTLFVSNLIALGRGKLYFSFLCLQMAFYCLALIGSWAKERDGRFFSISRIPYHFMLISWAMFRGWLRCFSRNRDVLWTPDRVGTCGRVETHDGVGNR